MISLSLRIAWTTQQMPKIHRENENKKQSQKCIGVINKGKLREKIQNERLGSKGGEKWSDCNR